LQIGYQRRCPSPFISGQNASFSFSRGLSTSPGG
jgi:hypothetical protein